MADQLAEKPVRREPAEALIPFVRPAWQHNGACNGVDPDLFFPQRGDSTKPAVAVCNTCPVETDCLEYALENHIMDGVWGGLPTRRRRKILSERAAAANMRMVS